MTSCFSVPRWRVVLMQGWLLSQISSINLSNQSLVTSLYFPVLSLPVRSGLYVFESTLRVLTTKILSNVQIVTSLFRIMTKEKDRWKNISREKLYIIQLMRESCTGAVHSSLQCWCKISGWHTAIFGRRTCILLFVSSLSLVDASANWLGEEHAHEQEDRILCWELVAKRGSAWLLHYQRSAYAVTVRSPSLASSLNTTSWCSIWCWAHRMFPME